MPAGEACLNVIDNGVFKTI